MRGGTGWTILIGSLGGVEGESLFETGLGDGQIPQVLVSVCEGLLSIGIAVYLYVAL